MRKLIAILAMILAPALANANSLTLTNRSDLCSGTATSLTYVVEITGTNGVSDVVSNLTGYFGSSNGGIVPTRWGITTDLGTNVVGTLVSNTVYGTWPQRTYWFTCSTSGSLSGTVWATSSGTYVPPAGATPGTGSAYSNPYGFTPSGASVTNVGLPAATVYSNQTATAATATTAILSNQAQTFTPLYWTGNVMTSAALGATMTLCTNMPQVTAGTNLVVGTPVVSISAVEAATNVAVKGTVNLAPLNTLLSNLVNQVAAINSNQHKLGMP